MITELSDIVTALDAYAGERPAMQHSRDRRAHVRLAPHQLQAPMEARLKYGPSLTLVDLSAGGALIETSTRLRPGARLVLEFVAEGSRQIAMPTRIMRAEIASLAGGVVYRGGCSFKELLPMPELASASGRTSASPLLTGPAPESMIARLQEALAGRIDVSGPAAADLVADLVARAGQGESPATLMAMVEDRIRRRVPLLSVAIGTTGARPGAGALAFDPPARPGEAACRVEFRPACPVGEADLGLLEAGASLIGALHGCLHSPTPVCA